MEVCVCSASRALFDACPGRSPSETSRTLDASCGSHIPELQNLAPSHPVQPFRLLVGGFHLTHKKFVTFGSDNGPREVAVLFQPPATRNFGPCEPEAPTRFYAGVALF